MKKIMLIFVLTIGIIRFGFCEKVKATEYIYSPEVIYEIDHCIVWKNLLIKEYINRLDSFGGKTIGIYIFNTRNSFGGNDAYRSFKYQRDGFPPPIDFYPATGKYSEFAYGVEGSGETELPLVREIEVEKNYFYKVLIQDFYDYFLAGNKKIPDDGYPGEGEPECFVKFTEHIDAFTREQCYILRNTVYAYYGYTFKNPELKKLFSEMKWYKPNPAFKESDIPESGRNLINLLKKREEILSD